MNHFLTCYMIVWWLLWLFEFFDEIMCKVNDSPNFAFARLCYLKIQVARPARPAKVISSLLDSPLQSVPRAFRCRRWQSYECNDANSQLQFLHLKFKNHSVCSLCVCLVWQNIGNLRLGPQPVQRVGLIKLVRWFFDDFLMAIWVIWSM